MTQPPRSARVRRRSRRRRGGKDTFYLVIAGVSLGLALVLLFGVPYVLRHFVLRPTARHGYAEGRNRTSAQGTIISVLRDDIGDARCLHGLEALLYTQYECIRWERECALNETQAGFLQRQLGAGCMAHVPLLVRTTRRCGACFGARGWSTPCVAACVHRRLCTHHRL